MIKMTAFDKAWRVVKGDDEEYGPTNPQHRCAECGHEWSDDDGMPCRCDEEWTQGILERAYWNKFIPWIPEAEGPNCFICGEPNPEMDVEGHDNVCRDCEVWWEWKDDDDGYGRKRKRD